MSVENYIKSGKLNDKLLWVGSDLPRHDLATIMATLIYLRWSDFMEAEHEAMAAFDGIDYQPVLPAAYHWRSWHAFAPKELQGFFSNQLLPALEKLNSSHHNSLSTYLIRIAPIVKKIASMSPSAWHPHLTWLADQPFETQSDRRALLDIFDAIIDVSVNRFRGKYAYLITPATSIELLVNLAAPSHGQRVYDPCFGFAGLLTRAYDYVLEQNNGGLFCNYSSLLSIAGVERVSDAFVIGLARLVLSGVDEPQLELGNSLLRSHSENMQNGFDLVLANPPIGMRVDPDGLDHYPIRTRDASSLFIQHALAQLRPDGRALIIVPDGLLFKRSEMYLRRMLVEKHTVEAVMSLPAGTFIPYTGIKTSILIIRRGGKTERIRMLDAEPYFNKHKGKIEVVIRSKQINALVQQFRSKEPAEHSWDVEAEELKKFDYDLTPKRRDLSALTGVLDSIPHEVQILKLGDFCKVMAGRSMPSENLLDYAPFLTDLAEQVLQPGKDKSIPEKDKLKHQDVPYVRIKDIQHGYASKASSWLTPEAASGVDPKWKLKSGDILISKSGSIGKVGLVRNGAVGAIAASGLVILRVDQDLIDPHFLLAYLESNECKKWFDAHARGATIKQISKNIFEELPVPVPPLQIQQNVTRRYVESKVNALNYLVQILTRGEQDPVADWLDRIEPELLRHDELMEDPLDLSFQSGLASRVSEIHNQMADETDSGNLLKPWFTSFASVASSLQGIDTIPPGPGLLSVLQESIRALDYSFSQIKGKLPTEEQARNVTSLLISQLQLACDTMFERVELYINSSTTELRAGETSEISITVENQGFLPLRNLTISTKPDWGSKQIAYLEEGKPKIIDLNGPNHKELDNIKLTIHWNAKLLDGRQVEGSREIVFEVIDSVSGVREEVQLFSGSPYVCGDPVKPERSDVFFGRDELLDQIRRQVMQSGNVVLLEGNRRSGKSSILWHLEGSGAIPGWLGVYCSLQGTEGSRYGAGISTAEIFRKMAKDIIKSLQKLGRSTPLPDGTVLAPGKKARRFNDILQKGISENSPFTDFCDYIEIVLEFLSRDKMGLLLMLDEFDEIQEGIDSGITSPQVPENIRFLIHEYSKFSVILAGTLRLRRLREEYWSALFGLSGFKQRVTSLPSEAAKKLVTSPVQGFFKYSREALERTIYLTAGQPFLLQCLCNRIWDMAAQLKTKSITLDIVDKAGKALVQDNEHFATLWDDVRYERRRLILSICCKEQADRDYVRLGTIHEQLISYGIEIDDETLISDLEFLRELEVIQLTGQSEGGHYNLSIPLMGTWIETQQDFAAIKRKARLETEDQL